MIQILSMKKQTSSHTINSSVKFIEQLQKQKRVAQKTPVDQDRIDDIYQILTKIQSKNLMLIQLLVFLIEKGFIRNQHKIYYFMDLYDAIKTLVSTPQAQQSACSQPNQAAQKQKQEQQQKFTKKKFIKIFKRFSEQVYPCDPFAFQNFIYNSITSNQHHEEVRLKIDENVKKLLTRDTINVLRKYQRELEIIFQAYLPENFNGGMGFSWREIKYLQKKLPIIAVFRFLWDAEISPHLTSSTFVQIVSKLIPPHSLLIGSGQKQGQFYSPQNFANYTREAINQKKIKLLDGDIGLSMFQFQILLIRIAAQIGKEKVDFTVAFENFLNVIHLKQIINNKGQTKGRPSRFQQTIKYYFQESRSAKNNLNVQKRQTKKKIQQILQVNTQGINSNTDEQNRNQFKNVNITTAQLIKIKKGLDDDHLPEVPEWISLVKDKQNDKNYNIQAKHIVIGQQLPKIPQKNKPIAPPKKSDKKDQLLTKYKPEKPQTPILSDDHIQQLTKIQRKVRTNTQFPIILTDVVYPTDIPNLYLNPKAEIYLQTTYIHLGERSYEKAYISYCKARSLCQNSKLLATEFYFSILQGQIYQAAGRDGMALASYHRAKELVQNSLANKDNNTLKYIAYKGLACCLFHIQQYQYSLKCFLKSKQLRTGQPLTSAPLPPLQSQGPSQVEPLPLSPSQLQVQTVEYAILENNIGCIYMILNRNNQAMKYFQVSACVMDLRLGKFHERSVVVQQNLAKNKKAFIEMVPFYKTMWKTYVQKSGIKTAVKAPKKK